jgi:hypothetical protein
LTNALVPFVTTSCKAGVITTTLNAPETCILQDGGLAQKRALLAKAYDALPAGGALIVYERLSTTNSARLPGLDEKCRVLACASDSAGGTQFYVVGTN